MCQQCSKRTQESAHSTAQRHCSMTKRNALRWILECSRYRSCFHPILQCFLSSRLRHTQVFIINTPDLPGESKQNKTKQKQNTKQTNKTQNNNNKTKQQQQQQQEKSWTNKVYFDVVHGFTFTTVKDCEWLIKAFQRYAHFSTLEILLFICLKKMYTFPYVALFDFKLWQFNWTKVSFRKYSRN